MKKIIALLLLISICFCFTACSLTYGRFRVGEAANVIKLSEIDTGRDGYAEFLEKLETFAAELSARLYEDSDKNENMCISPISVYMALALAAEASDGQTRDEILDAVGVSYDEINNFTRYLYSYANREFEYTNIVGSEKILAFEELSNSLWADKRVTLKDSGINMLSGRYHCDLFSASFENGEADRAINSYIKEKTHGVIDAGIDFDPETYLSFTDEKYDFLCSDGSISSKKLLRGYNFDGKAYQGDGFTSFYTGTKNGFKIKFILPDEGKSLDEVFNQQTIYTCNNLGDYGYIDHENKLIHHTRVLFPEYKAFFDGNIADTLRDDFGIQSLFDVHKCDFSNLTDDKVVLSGVIHKCSLDVNARGIEGAAVTVMPMAGAPGPLDGYEDVYHEYVVDRAFGFILTDSNDTVLFCGTVNRI